VSTEQSKASLYALFAIVAVGFLLRFGAFLGTPVESPIRSDAAQYYAGAHHLRNAGVYSTSTRALVGLEQPTPDAARSPGYPLLLALLIDEQPTRAGLDRVLLFQVLLSTLAIMLVYALSARLMNRDWGLIAALLTAFSPHLINLNLYLLTETLFGFALLLFVWSISRLGAQPSLPRLGLASAVLGVAALVHPAVQHFILVWVVLVALTLRPPLAWRSGLTVALVAVLGFGAVFGPWVYRNLSVLGASEDDQPIINTLHHGIYPNFMYQDRPESYAYPYRFDPNSPRISSDIPAVLNEIGRRFTEEPARHLGWYLIDKPIALWSWDSVQGFGDSFIYPVSDSPYLHNPGFQASHRLMRLLHWPLVILGGIGALLVWLPVVSRRLDPAQRLTLRSMSLLLLYLTLVHMVGAPFPRYTWPLRPLLYVMALVPLFLGSSPKRVPAQEFGDQAVVD